MKPSLKNRMKEIFRDGAAVVLAFEGGLNLMVALDESAARNFPISTNPELGPFSMHVASAIMTIFAAKKLVFDPVQTMLGEGLGVPVIEAKSRKELNFAPTRFDKSLIERLAVRHLAASKA